MDSLESILQELSRPAMRLGGMFRRADLSRRALAFVNKEEP